MTRVQYEEMFPWEIAHAIAQAPLCYVPLGVLEWHGEHNAVGLDAIKAHAICVEAARRSGGIVIPALYWGTDEREDLSDGSYLTGGIEHGERYHVPGSMFWLRPDTFYSLLLDMYEAMRRRGFRVIVVVCGHWSPRVYLPTVRRAGEAFLRSHPGMRWVMMTDQQMAPDLHYPPEHAAGGETSFLMALRSDLVDLSATFETDRSLAPYYANELPHLQRRRATRSKYIGINPVHEDGSNDPDTTASVERGRELLRVIADRVAGRATSLLAEVRD